ncbi:hypothetical protein [Anaplasma phagocytophilum]
MMMCFDIFLRCNPKSSRKDTSEIYLAALKFKG